MYKIPDSPFVQACHDITAWLSSGPTQHLVAKVLPLEETAEAHEFHESGQAIGTVIVSLES